MITRREFVKHSVLGAATFGAARALSLRAWAAEGDGPKQAVLKLGSQESRIPGRSLREKVLKLEQWGGVGLEVHGAKTARIQQIKDAIKGTNVAVSALCWGSRRGDLVALEAERRTNGIAALKEALTMAGELQARGVIFVPCFHKQSTLSPAELDKVLLDILPDLGEHAHHCGTRVLLEPLNRRETFYINRLEQAVVICEKVSHPGVAMMGDFYHMGREERNDREAFVRAGKWVHHVHLGSRIRVLPGQDDRSFVEGFRGLKLIGYQGYCSLECRVKKGTDPNVEIPKSFRFLEQQWQEATI